MDHAFTVGVEEEFQIVDPDDLGAALARLRAARVERAGLRRPDQARDAPVDRRGRHARSARTIDGARATRSSASGASSPTRAERVGLRIAAAGTHPFSNWMDQVISPGERYENIVEELQQLARSLLIFGLHVHVAVPDRASDDRPDERGALLPAAPAGALDELAVLDGPRHRPEVVPHDGLPPLSAHRHSRSLRLVERVRGLRRNCSSSCTASTTARRSGGTCGRIRRSARWSSASATCRRAPRAIDRDRRARAGDRRQAVPAARAATSGFRLYRRALIEENKWRAAR